MDTALLCKALREIDEDLTRGDEETRVNAALALARITPVCVMNPGFSSCSLLTKCIDLALTIEGPKAKDHERNVKIRQHFYRYHIARRVKESRARKEAQKVAEQVEREKGKRTSEELDDDVLQSSLNKKAKIPITGIKRGFEQTEHQAPEHKGDLYTHGVVVFPFKDSEKLAFLLQKNLREMPEYLPNADRQTIGGFGAKGNPASFHIEGARAARLEFYKCTRSYMQEYIYDELGTDEERAKKYHYSLLFDRVTERDPDFSITPETWHRDVKKGDLPEGSIIFGGWMNMNEKDGQDQYLVCILGSHKGKDADDAQEKKGGFAVLSKYEIKRQKLDECLKAQANFTSTESLLQTNEKGHVIVPPGHGVVFFQKILHCVKDNKHLKGIDRRIFVGHYLSTSKIPLFEDTIRWAQTGAVPRLPSGQIPPMFAKNHYAWFNKKRETGTAKQQERGEFFRKWGERTFIPECLFKRMTTWGEPYSTPGSRENETPEQKDINKNRTMPSLQALGLHKPEYTYSSEDLVILVPQRLF